MQNALNVMTTNNQESSSTSTTIPTVVQKRLVIVCATGMVLSHLQKRNCRSLCARRAFSRGLLVRYHQSKFPAEVVGVVPVESSHEESLQHVGSRVVRIPELTVQQFQSLIDEGKAHRPRNAEPDLVPTTIFSPYDRLPVEIQNGHMLALKRCCHLSRTGVLTFSSI